MQLSTSQWVALLTAIPAAVAYCVYFKAAEVHPESALALNLDEFYAAHPEQKPRATTDEQAGKEVDTEEKATVATPSPDDVVGDAHAENLTSKEPSAAGKESG